MTRSNMVNMTEAPAAVRFLVPLFGLVIVDLFINSIKYFYCNMLTS